MSLKLTELDLLELTIDIGKSPRPQLVDAIRRIPDLAAFMEFFAIRWNYWRKRRVDILENLPKLAETSWLSQIAKVSDYPMLGLRPGVSPIGKTFKLAAMAELQEIPHELSQWAAGAPFDLFQQRFHRTLCARALPRQLAYAITGAFVEMASNADEHAQSPVPPVACYHVTPEFWSFSVTDVGRGILSSLRQNPVYQTIETETEALQLALQDGVSRFSEEERGTGFSTVFKALVDHSASLRFRSGGALGSWSGESPTASKVTLQSLPLRRSGFHVRVSSRRDFRASRI